MSYRKEMTNMLHSQKFELFDKVNVPMYGVYNAQVLGTRKSGERLFYDVQYEFDEGRLMVDCFAEDIMERVV
jgi:hypothetical protein